ncbi:MAG: hypothetical protein U0176_11280 [Bacteroidia bacterium]
MKTKWTLLFLLFSISLTFVACERESLVSDLDPTDEISTERTAPEHPPTALLPPGWSTHTSLNGITVYKRTNPYDNRINDFVVKVDLDLGATIKIKMGSSNIATAANPNPTFTKRTMSWFWTNRPTGAKVLVNGTFFDSFFSLTSSISYPVKGGGTMYTTGSSTCQLHSYCRFAITRKPCQGEWRDVQPLQCILDTLVGKRKCLFH